MIERAQIVALLLALTVACGGPKVEQGPTALDERTALLQRVAVLESELPSLLGVSAVPGLSIAVVLEGEVVWIRGFGLRRADVPDRNDVDSDSIFAAASLTKPVFAYAVMQLVDEGRLELDRPLVEYLDYEDLAADERARSITSRMVLSHSSGLPNWRPNRWTDNPEPLRTQFEPGSRYQYSGEGMIYLQRVVEEITGQTLDDVLNERVFVPLGMSRSSLLWADRFEANYALPHNEDQVPREDRRPTTAWAAGTLQTTAADYARFLIAVMKGDGLADGTLERILTPQVEVQEGVWWGLGWGLEDGENGRAVWQWGHDPGSRAFVLGLPERQLGLVFFANSDNGMLLLRRIVEGTVGGADHPALDQMGYDSFDSPRRLVSIELRRTALEEGAEAVSPRYFELREEFPEEAFDESMLNRLGYDMLGGERLDLAIALFELNVEAYPEASNTYDSLGEAYMIRGDTEKAIANYERSLELDPENGNAVAMLDRLRSAAPKP